MSITTKEHAHLATAEEVYIETSLVRQPTVRTIIWVVEVGGTLYARSFLGGRGKWYQRALRNPSVRLESDDVSADFTAQHEKDKEIISAVSDAFIAKYPPGSSVNAMVAPDVTNTTIRLIPV